MTRSKKKLTMIASVFKIPVHIDYSTQASASTYLLFSLFSLALLPAAARDLSALMSASCYPPESFVSTGTLLLYTA